MKSGGLSRPEAASEGATVPFLGAAAVQRLCIDLISAEQQRLLRERRISPRQRIEACLASCHPGEEGLLEIGEDALGLDSLMLLDLVGVLSRFFSLGDSGAEDLLLVHRTLGNWSRVVMAHFEQVGTGARIGFETSGSAGEPKRIVHPSSHLLAEIDEHLNLGAEPWPTRVVSAVPPRHIYGFLWSVLLPQVAKVPVLDVHHSAGEFLARVCRPGDLVIGTPFSWERAAASGHRLPPDIRGVTSGGPSTDATWRAVEALGLERLVEIYGSTETGGIGWRVSRKDPFRLSERFERAEHALFRRSTGEVVAVQDDLNWLVGDRFEVGSRLDGIIQVAGVNVSLTAVAAVLRSVDGVADAVARLDGPRIKALVIPKIGGANHVLLEDALRARAARDLPAPARPDRYLFEAALPVNSMGKPVNW